MKNNQTCLNCIYSDKNREWDGKIKCWMKHQWVEKSESCQGHRMKPADKFYQEEGKKHEKAKSAAGTVCTEL